MTDAAIQALIDAAKTATPGDLVTWAELKVVLEALKSQVSLSDLSPAVNQIPKFNGTAWVADDDATGSGAGSTYTPPAELFGTNPDNIEGWKHYPSNNGTVYPGYGKAMFFSGDGWTRVNGVNASGRPNVVATFHGYNHNLGGGRYDTAEAAFGFRTETHFEIGGGPLFELHLPEFTDESGNIKRICSWYIRKDGTVPVAPDLQGAGIGFNSWWDGTPWGWFNHEGQIYNKQITGSGYPKWTSADRVHFVNNKFDFEIDFLGQYTFFGKPNALEADNPYIQFRDSLQIGESGGWKRSFALWGNAFFQNGYLFFGNTTTANAINGSIFVEGGALKFKGGSGTVTTIANA